MFYLIEELVWEIALQIIFLLGRPQQSSKTDTRLIFLLLPNNNNKISLYCFFTPFLISNADFHDIKKKKKCKNLIIIRLETDMKF